MTRVPFLHRGGKWIRACPAQGDRMFPVPGSIFFSSGKAQDAQPCSRRQIRVRTHYQAICPDGGVFITCCKTNTYSYNLRSFVSNYFYPGSRFWGRWGSLRGKPPFLPRAATERRPQAVPVRRRRSLGHRQARGSPFPSSRRQIALTALVIFPLMLGWTALCRAFSCVRGCRARPPSSTLPTTI